MYEGMSSHAEELGWVGRQLGLRLGTDWSYVSGAAVMALDGHVDGVRVHVHHVQPWKDSFARLTISAYLSPPGDLRLWIRPSYVAREDLVPAHDVQVGDAAFDEAFDVRADEPSRARALLTPALRAHLGSWLRPGAHLRFHVTDEEVRLDGGSNLATPLGTARLLGDVQAAARLATAMNESLRGVPSAAHLVAHAETWRDYAALRGLAFSASPLAVIGTLEGASFAARATPVGRSGYGVDVRLRFAAPLPWLLKVRAARFFDFLDALIGPAEGAHLKTGDAPFDAAMCVSTTAPEPVLAFLDAPIRAALLALLRDDEAVVMDHEGIAVRTETMADPQELARIAERIAVVARKLHDSAGPYR